MNTIYCTKYYSILRISHINNQNRKQMNKYNTFFSEKFVIVNHFTFYYSWTIPKYNILFKIIIIAVKRPFS